MILWLAVFLMVAVWFWPGIWFRLVRHRIEVDIQLERSQVECGAEIPLTVTLRNKSWFPCPHVEVVMDLSPGLSASMNKMDSVLCWNTYLFMRQELTATLHCYALQRGLHQLVQRDVLIRLNEGFGLRHLFLWKTIEQEVVVLPQRVSTINVLPTLDAWAGSLEIRRWLHPDEAMLRGIRPYQVGDAYRHIEWLATARTGEWMTKEFSTTTDVVVTLLLNAQFFDTAWMGTDVAAFDELCSVTAAVARALATKGIPTVFGSNASNPRHPFLRWYGEQSAHGIEVLLGRFYPVTSTDFSALLQSLRLREAVNPLIITARHFSASHLQLLRRHLQTGRDVTVVWTGEPELAYKLRSMGVRVVEPLRFHADGHGQVAQRADVAQ